MTPRTRCALLIDPPASGDWNMAVDEALLESFADQDVCCWRFYGWREPTLSLGYFQTHDDRRRHPASLTCPIVRRASGGGAIVHDVELTYSLIAPAGTPLASQRERLYRMVHETLIETLALLGVPGASLFGHETLVHPEGSPFLCFERRSPGDVVYGDAKIAGSAQRRRRDAVLQHGSVLLGRSTAAPELPGIKELASREISNQTLTEAWLPRLETHLELAFFDHYLESSEQDRATELVRVKYASDRWTRNRTA
ncbi:MAG TPA: lipoate--protein ligase family protein [Planctomycetaceae bacterium]|nr:lipoate--protein ligase family protein [Planctomycetaceae bacterium]